LRELGNLDEIKILETQPGNYPYIEIGNPDYKKDMIPVQEIRNDEPTVYTYIPYPKQWLIIAAGILGQTDLDNPDVKTLAELIIKTQAHHSLNGDKSTILILTKKGGRKKPQPIPQSLVPLYNTPLSPISEGRLNRQLKKLCKQVQIPFPTRGGFHSIRRRVVTVLTEIEHSEISIHHFMRWSVPRQFAMLSRYRQTPVEESDMVILSKHPYVKLWEEVKPYLLTQNNSYTGNLLSDKI